MIRDDNLEDGEAADEREVLVDDCCLRVNEDADERLT